MKTKWIVIALSVSAALQIRAQFPPPPDDSPYAAAERSAHETRWQRVTWITNDVGRAVARTNSFVELATGLNFLDERTQQWQPSREEWQVYPDAIVAQAGRHKVILATNLNLGGCVDVLTPDGVRLISNPVGLGFYDPVDGKHQLLAEIKDCAPQRGAANNEIVFRDCFNGVRGSIRYLYALAGVRQHVVLEQRLQLPAGFSDKTRLECYTEFASNTPLPQIKSRVLRREKDPVLRAQMVEPDFTDMELAFGGDMKMQAGTAFTLGDTPETRAIRVGKRFEMIGGRPVLTESVEFRQLEPLLARLAAVERKEAGLFAVHSSRQVKRATERARLPNEHFRALDGENAIQLASSPLSAPAVVIDYELLSSATNFTFKADSTYYATNLVNLSETTTIEGGTVIKYPEAGDGAVNILGTLVCKTDAYRLAIFTSKNDDSVGETLPSSSGTPAKGTSIYLVACTPPVALKNARLSYAGTALYAIYLIEPDEAELRDVQFTHCDIAIDGFSSDFVLRNVLFSDCSLVFSGGYSLRGEHVTVNGCDTLLDSADFYFTNSVFANVTNLTSFPGVMTGSHNGFYQSSSFGYNQYSSASDPFQTAGAGAHYLAVNSTNRNVGTTKISTNLLADLQGLTTYPPLLLTNNFTANTNLSPQALRDTDTPDLGYHYAPLDYVVSGRTVTNSTLTLTNGVALGTYGSSASYGISVASGGKLISEGQATDMNRIVRYNTVQEQATTNWSSSTVAPAIKVSTSSSPEPQVQCRFTAFSILGSGGYHFYGKVTGSSGGYLFNFQDCQFAGSGLYLERLGVSVTNSLWERVNVEMDDVSQTPNHFLYNNLFFGGVLTGYPNDASTWHVKDNLFDKTAISLDGVDHGYNGYVTNFSRITSTQATDVVLTNSPIYQTSFLGRYYYPTNGGLLSRLINAGSRGARSAGLYQYTTTTNQAVELDSTVDIGFHFGYAVDVRKDLLLIYNTTSTNSTWVKDYYLAHRPLINGANVLGIACQTNEIGTDFTNQFLNHVLVWLAANPTKLPQYVILFLDIPSTFYDVTNAFYISTSVALHDSIPAIKPFVTSINMRTTNDCKAYIDKLEYIGTNYSPGKVVISASANGVYGNTNYVVDNVRRGYGHIVNYTAYGSTVYIATNGLLAAGTPLSAIQYADGLETITNSTYYDLPHLSNVTNVTGYISWGAHSSLGISFATNGVPQWRGNSRWWIIETIESWNGKRDDPGAFTSNFLQWFSENAFGGVNYSNTPVGAVTYVFEPYLPGVNDASSYFGLWASGKNFANCAWYSWSTHPAFQPVGDPFVTR